MRFLPEIQVLWHSNGVLWASKQHRIVCSRDFGTTWMAVAGIPAPPVQRLLSRIKLCRRLLRLGIRSYIQPSDREFIAFSNGSIFRWQQGDRRPLRIGSVRYGRGPLLQGSCSDENGNCYYGEYWGNQKIEPVNIYKLKSDTNSWESFYSFPHGAVRHIHAVQFDPVSKHLWVATGDDDQQCRIGYFTKSAHIPELVCIASGNQMARAVSLLFTREYVYWGTDAGRGTGVKANHIYRWSRRSSQIEQVAQVGGPVYYSTVDAQERLFVSTVVEGSESEPDRFARVWMCSDGTNWREIARWKKDRYPLVFGYGVMSFAQGSTSDAKLFVAGNGVEGSPGTWIIDLDDDVDQA